MNGQRAVAVVLLVCSVVAIGTMAASLDAVVTASPDDAIDVDTDSLPFAGDGAGEIADSYKQGEEGDDRADVQSGSDGSSVQSGGGDQSDGEPREGGGDGQAQAADGQPDGDDSTGAGGDQGSRRGGSDGAGGGSGPGGASGFEESLWALFDQLLAALVAIAALLVVVVGLIFLVRQRHRILARLRALARRYGLLATDRDPTTPAPFAVDDGVDNAVERAWGEMIRASGARPRRSATPRECVGAAVAAGLDREPAEGLTDLYEQVRYGDRAANSDQVSRAFELLEEVTPESSPRLADGGSTASDAGVDDAGDGAVGPGDEQPASADGEYLGDRGVPSSDERGSQASGEGPGS